MFSFLLSPDGKTLKVITRKNYSGFLWWAILDICFLPLCHNEPLLDCIKSPLAHWLASGSSGLPSTSQSLPQLCKDLGAVGLYGKDGGTSIQSTYMRIQSLILKLLNSSSTRVVLCLEMSLTVDRGEDMCPQGSIWISKCLNPFTIFLIKYPIPGKKGNVPSIK